MQPHLSVQENNHVNDLKGWEDEEDPEDCYAVFRGKLNKHSFHLVSIVSEFGRRGGFDALIERLSDDESNMSLHALRHILSPLSKVYLYFKSFSFHQKQ